MLRLAEYSTASKHGKQAGRRAQTERPAEGPASQQADKSFIPILLRGIHLQSNQTASSRAAPARPPLAAGDQQKTAEPNRTGILGRFLPSEWPRVRYSPSLSPPPHTPFALRPGCSLGTLSEHNSQLPLEELRTWDGSTRRLSVLCFHVSNPVPLTATLLASRCLHL